MKLLVRTLLCLIISFSLIEFPIMNAHAGMISTSEALTQMGRNQEEQNVSDFLNRTDVKEQMIKLGVNPDEASKRLASLSDSEVRKLSSDINHATIGGDVTGILVLVLIVILIIYFAKRI